MDGTWKPASPLSPPPGLGAKASTFDWEAKRRSGLSPFVRVNKYLSERAGISRREADRCIEKGEVSVNGAVPFLGQLIDPEKDIVEFRGRVIEPEKAERPAEKEKTEAKEAENDPFVAIRDSLAKIERDITETIEENRIENV